MSRIVKVIISCLITGLTILSIYTGNLLYNKTHKQTLTNDNKPQQEQSIRIIDKETIQKALNNENRLVVLSGQVETEATFTNERISDNDVKLKWLKQQWNKINSKELKVNSTYNYEFSYDLTNLPITIHNNTINITIIKGNLNLSKCELNSIETKDRVGLLESKFTPSEINEINSRVKAISRNSIQSNEELRDRCFDNVESNIKNILNKVTHKNTNIVFHRTNYDVVDQSEASTIDNCKVISNNIE